MNANAPSSCQCPSCPGAGCTCGCQQPAAPVTPTASSCACGPQCRCGADCRCAAPA